MRRGRLFPGAQSDEFRNETAFKIAQSKASMAPRQSYVRRELIVMKAREEAIRL
jgi:hypothetical protein